MEGALYPTVAMLNMMNERVTLEAHPENKQAIKAFQEKYLIKTALSTVEAMEKIITLWRLHAHSGRNLTFTQKLEELNQVTQFVTDKIDVIGAFYCQLVAGYVEGRHVFYGVIADGKTSIPFDLEETVETLRYITVKECGACKKKAEEIPLLQCGKCRKAAYCNAECQKADRRFHKHFCAEFAKETNK